LSDYAYRLTNTMLGSELLPAFLRTRAMRALGFSMSLEAVIWAGANLRSKKISLAPGVFINIGFYHDGYDHLVIEDNVRIGPFVRVLTATHDIGPSKQRGQIEVVGKPVCIKDGCWIGSGVTIMPGVTINRGCVIAANSIVFDDTEPDGMYAGNPARRVRELEV
jgi:maltose O-acetyltransferase